MALPISKYCGGGVYRQPINAPPYRLANRRRAHLVDWPRRNGRGSIDNPAAPAVVAIAAAKAPVGTGGVGIRRQVAARIPAMAMQASKGGIRAGRPSCRSQ